MYVWINKFKCNKHNYYFLVTEIFIIGADTSLLDVDCSVATVVSSLKPGKMDSYMIL